MFINNSEHDGELEKSRHKYRNLFENAVAGIYRSRLDGSAVLDANQAFCDLAGCTRKEMLSEPATFRWADPKTREEMVKQLNKDGAASNYEADFVAKSGEIKHCLVSAKLYPQEGYIEKIIFDITERKRVEEKLKESEERFKVQYHGSPIPTFTWQKAGKDFVMVDYNNAANKVTNGEVIRFLNKTANYMYKDHQEILQDLHRCFDEKTIISRELQSMHFMPGRFIVATYVFVPEDIVMVHVEDITERKKAEETLRKHERFLRNIFKTMKDGFGVFTIEGRISEVNDAMCSMLGYNRSELLARRITDIVAGEGLDITASRLHRVMEGRAETFESRHRRKDGSTFDVEISLNYLNAGEGRFICISRDITERKRDEKEKAKLESQSRQLQKAESLTRMAGAIAHHFNNQLQAVIGNLELALDKNWGEDSVERMEAATQAAGKAVEVSKLMLAYLGQSTGKFEPLDISEVCRRSLPMLHVVMPADVVLETDLHLPGPIVNANENQIQQVIANLLANAWEAGGESGGSIHLRVKTVSPAEIPTEYRFPIDWQPQDLAYACLEVTDSGCGIAETDIENLFDPFFSNKFTGRGLGLSVVLGVTRAHQGAVTVESDPGRGSAFRVFLPVSAEEILRQPDKVAKILETEWSGKVLLVEDNELVRNMAATMLTHLGFTVIEAKDGVEAVEVFRQRKDEFRLVLCDLIMPRMNGWETLSAIRRLMPDIPVILASGYDEAHVMAGDHTEWPQAFLGKPYMLKALNEAIRHALINKKV